MTGLTIVTDVLQGLGVVGQNDPPTAADAQIVISQLERLTDNWNADRPAIFADAFPTYTITPSLQPHTIGPTGATWTATQRPVSIEGAKVFIDASNTLVLTIRDARWWQDQPVPTLTSIYATDVYYNPTWPNGAFYFWPVPTGAYTIQLRVRGILSSYTLATTFTMPPGYRDAMTLTLEEACAETFGKEISQKKALDASKARARIFANNIVVPKICTLDPGMPGGGPGWFDYMTGMSRP